MLASGFATVDIEDATRLVNEVHAEWYRPLLRYGVRLSGSLQVAEDFVQEAFVSLYRASLDGRTVDCPKAYLIAAVRHQAQRAWATHRAGRVPIPVEELTEPLAAPAADEVNLLWDNLQRLLTNLTPRETEVVLLRAESLSYGEIAGQLGIAVTSVGTLLARAIGKLQAVTHPYGERAASRPAESGQADASRAEAPMAVEEDEQK
jgi:RNA polymerase sigma factor (sigma-70 family)